MEAPQFRRQCHTRAGLVSERMLRALFYWFQTLAERGRFARTMRTFRGRRAERPAFTVHVTSKLEMKDMSCDSPSRADALEGGWGGEHFPALDGARGVAAIAVLIYHMGMFANRPWMPRGYLAVDFFFLLSGFVMARAYESKLRSSSMSLTSFAKIRVQRLYPCLFVGLSLAVFERAEQGLPVAPREWLSFLLIPSAGVLFLLDQPLWSLFYECLANAAHALGLARVSRRVLLSLLAVATTAMLWLVLVRRDVNGGPASWEVGVAAVRLGFGYLLGIAIFRHWTPKVKKSFAGMAVTGLAVAFACPSIVPETIFAAGLLFAGFPIVLLCAATSIVSRATHRALTLLGGLSYPLYVIHWPLLTIARPWAAAHGALGWNVAGVAILLISIMLERFYDEPLRSYLRKRRLARSTLSYAPVSAS